MCKNYNQPVSLYFTNFRTLYTYVTTKDDFKIKVFVFGRLDSAVSLARRTRYFCIILRPYYVLPY